MGSFTMGHTHPTGLAASPVTRAAARRRGDKSSRASAAAAANAAAAAAAAASADPSAPQSTTLAGSLKRRWATHNPPLTSDVDLAAHDEDELEGGAADAEGVDGGAQEDGAAGAEGEGMEMDGMEGWDGRGERPGKRVARRRESTAV